MDRSGWIATVVATGTVALVLGGVAGGVAGSQLFPKVEVTPVPSPSPSPVVEIREVEVPGPVQVRTPEACRRALNLARSAYNKSRSIAFAAVDGNQATVDGLIAELNVLFPQWSREENRCLQS